jgi:hypothetical protein
LRYWLFHSGLTVAVLLALPHLGNGNRAEAGFVAVSPLGSIHARLAEQMGVGQTVVVGTDLLAVNTGEPQTFGDWSGADVQDQPKPVTAFHPWSQWLMSHHSGPGGSGAGTSGSSGGGFQPGGDQVALITWPELTPSKGVFHRTLTEICQYPEPFLRSIFHPPRKRGC